jgi:hypothetical protein
MFEDQRGPVTIVLESWRAPDIEPPVLSITHNPFSGDSVKRMLNFRPLLC